MYNLNTVRDIDGIDPGVEIEIDPRTGRWIRFVKKPPGYTKTLQETYETGLDSNSSLSNPQRTALKSRNIDR